MSIELKKIENIQNISKLSVGERINYLNKLKNEIIHNEDNIYSALYNDLNKPKFEVYTSEIGFLLNEIELFIKHLNEWSKPKKVMFKFFLGEKSGFWIHGGGTCKEMGQICSVEFGVGVGGVQ